MELKDLVGEHILDGVDFSNEKVKTWRDEFEDCQVCRFRLDGTVYSAVEDPDDGYRSSMNELTVDEAADIKNQFPACRVLGRHRTNDVLELIDVATGKVVLEVGTDNTDDYYPSYVASFHPEAMAINA